MDRNQDYFSDAGQDKFVSKVLAKNNGIFVEPKKNGHFLEIGREHPINFNNTYLLEKKFDWKGIIIEYDNKYLNSYEKYRKNSYPIIQDALQIDYHRMLRKYNFPKTIDYLQIDLEVHNSSTISVLQKLEREVMDDYTFSVITFEHDIYTGNYFDTMKKSREIFKQQVIIWSFKISQ